MAQTAKAMTTDGFFLAKLRELERADRLHALHVADEVRCELKKTHIDRKSFVGLEDALRRHGIDLGVEWIPKPLAFGETYLLAYEPNAKAGSVVRMRAGSPAARLVRSSQCAIEQARFGLEAVLRQHNCGAPLDRSLISPSIGLMDTAQDVLVDGASLGLSSAIAILSLWLRQPPRASVAGSARIDAAGRLIPVEWVDEKAKALLDAWPNVKTIVVAQGQAWREMPHQGIKEAKTLWDAFEHFGLAPTAASLPEISPDELERIVATFESENRGGRSLDDWRILADQAHYCATALESSAAAMKALGWAALFALHSGDHERADQLAKSIPESSLAELDRAARVWVKITQASLQIDRSAPGAVAFAEECLAEAALLEGEQRNMLYGRALGTLGRTLMHQSRVREALQYLLEAAEHHRDRYPHEEPRSRTYQAIALRLLGQNREALEIIEGALAKAATLKRHSATASVPYLELERGRVMLALGRPELAVEAFRLVEKDGKNDENHPRISAVRGLAAAYRRNDRLEAAADALSRCLAVAERGVKPIHKLAARAAGDALVDVAAGLASGVEETKLHAVWRKHFDGADNSDAAIRATLEPDIY